MNIEKYLNKYKKQTSMTNVINMVDSDINNLYEIIEDLVSLKLSLENGDVQLSDLKQETNGLSNYDSMFYNQMTFLNQTE